MVYLSKRRRPAVVNISGGTCYRSLTVGIVVQQLKLILNP